ncbi:hypothetical protein ACFVZH_38115 [Streptomyces sp. NPDC059534]|uniref:hypothetical protein n=1 Tax=Streptomyces sp. NPDC059534 TaxID=3346859 RepID=UPI0036C08FDD
MRRGHTYTRQFDIDPRQHELLGVDLGEGAPRRALVLGLILFVVWTGPLLLLFGLPSEISFTAYFLPPIVTAVYGTQRSVKVEQRWNITRWALSARYLVIGHRPIICGGRRAATRSEWLPRRARWAGKTDVLLASPLGSLVERFLGEDREDAVPVGAGDAIRLDTHTRLYGPDAVAKAYGRKAMQQYQKGEAA